MFLHLHVILDIFKKENIYRKYSITNIVIKDNNIKYWKLNKIVWIKEELFWSFDFLYLIVLPIPATPVSVLDLMWQIQRRQTLTTWGPYRACRLHSPSTAPWSWRRQSPSSRQELRAWSHSSCISSTRCLKSSPASLPWRSGRMCPPEQGKL